MNKHINIPIFIPHEGCPNDCIFCNQRKISGQIRAPLEAEMVSIIEEHLQTINPNDYCEIAFFGGSFTGLPQQQQMQFLKTAHRYVIEGRIKGIRLSTRPDYINVDILNLLKKYSVRVIELGVQSLDEQVLERSYRNYSSQTVIDACRMIKEYGFSLGVQTMIGLPGDTLQKSIDTAKRLIELAPEMVRIYPTLVIKDTELAKQYLNNNYKPLTLDEAVSWCSILVPMYEDTNIQVLRIGLQDTVDLQKGNEVIAGPAHPAIGDLVYSNILLKHMTNKLDNMDIKQKKMIIHVAQNQVSLAIGQHRRNINFLKEKYGFSHIKVQADQKSQKSVGFEFLD